MKPLSRLSHPILSDIFCSVQFQNSSRDRSRLLIASGAISAIIGFSSIDLSVLSIYIFVTLRSPVLPILRTAG